jgi:D-serine deaminase-like pyridoxal phosphate-dependent protein
MGIAEGRRSAPGDRWSWTNDVGLSVEETPTPALLLDIEVATANADLMGRRFRSLSASLRPHVKAHKCAQLARLQLDNGAIGVTTATLAEAEAMASAGVEDVLIANEVVGAGAAERLVSIAASTRLTVAADDESNLVELGRRASGAGSEIGVLIEVDVGMGRGGARSPEEALSLARRAMETPGVELRGLMGYEGHCASEPDAAVRERETRAAMQRLVEVAERSRADGMPVDVVSAGATGTYEVTGSYRGVTEVQAGTYILMDVYHEALAPEFSFALTVLATAISRHGDLVVFDAGRKGVGNDLLPPRLATGVGELAFINEEHAGFRFPEGSPYRVGDRAALVPGYAPTTVNLFGAFHVVESGRVVDLWPVLARR